MKPKRPTSVEEILTQPPVAKQSPIIRMNWAKTESVFDVNLCHKTAVANVAHNGDCIIKGRIFD